MYTANIVALIQQQGLQPNFYAEHTQIVGSCCPTPADKKKLRHRIETCVTDITYWMSPNRLQQNTSKSELMWCSSLRRRHLVPSDHLIVGSDIIVPVKTEC